MLPMVQRIFFNKLAKDENRVIPDLSRREIAILVPLIVLMLWVGLQPAALLRRMEPSVEAVLQRVERQAPVAAGPLAVPAVASAASPGAPAVAVVER
jgi:NADH-quinone oxidoreductase subunit M